MSKQWASTRTIEVVIPGDPPNPMPGYVGIIPLDLPREQGEKCPLCGEEHGPGAHPLAELLGLNVGSMQPRTLSGLVVCMAEDVDAPYGLHSVVHYVAVGGDLRGFLVRDVFYTPAQSFVCWDPPPEDTP